jgi:hypothetical protein
LIYLSFKPLKLFKPELSPKSFTSDFASVSPGSLAGF